jgi:hypothetical protein
MTQLLSVGPTRMSAVCARIGTPQFKATGATRVIGMKVALLTWAGAVSTNLAPLNVFHDFPVNVRLQSGFLVLKWWTEGISAPPPRLLTDGGAWNGAPHIGWKNRPH